MTVAEEFYVPKRGPGRPPKVREPTIAPVAVRPAEIILPPIGPVRRWKASLFDEWLLYRLQDRWAGISEAMWRSKLASFTGGNDFYFVTNDLAILLVSVACRHAITQRAVILEVFGWARDARKAEDKYENWWLESDSEGRKALIVLYRSAKLWAESMNAVRMILGTCCDIMPAELKHDMRSTRLADVLL